MPSIISTRTCFRRVCRSASKALAFALLAALPLPAQYGDARRGGEIFQKHNCVLCHSINGFGGKIAPDLARRSSRDFTPAVMAATMWNHGPAMWREMAAHNFPIPSLPPTEINDLYAYFYSIRYFDKPGDAARGKTVFTTKKCSTCHAITPAGGEKKGPPVSQWPAIADRIRWAEEMWNHAGRMMDELQKSGVPWPTFTPQEMGDLLVYIRNLPERPAVPPALVFEDPVLGEKLFSERGCTRCHTVANKEAGKIDLIGAARGARTFTELGVAMWNHLPQMRRRARANAAPFPAFNENEMSNLIAFLFARRYFEEQGSASAGRRVFESKRCSVCHDHPGSGAPSLKAKRGKFSAPQMASALWLHGPKMLAQFGSLGLPWPVFSGREMADLIAYLNR